MSDLTRLLVLMRPYRGWMLAGAALSLVTLLANVVLMAVSGWFIAAMALAGVAGVSMNYFTPAAIIRAMAILRTVGRYGERLVTHEVTFRLIARLRVWFYERLEPLAPAGLQAHRAGDLFSRIRADIDTLENFYLRVLVPAAVGAFAGLAFALFLSLTSIPLGIAEVLLLAAAGIGAPLLADRFGRDAARRQVETAAELRTHLIETRDGLAELLVYGAADSHAARANQLSRALIEDQKRLSLLQGLTQGFTGLAANAALWLTLVIATPLVRQDAIAPANLAMLALFVIASFEAVTALPLAVQVLPTVKAAARRLFELVDADNPTPDPAASAALPDQPVVTLSDVSFTYGAPRPAVLDGIDLTLAPGRKLALLGPTGSGKSSLVNLLLRFWRPNAGTLAISGTPYAAFDGETIRALFAVADQRAHLFDASIRENLQSADPNADDAALLAACKTAQLGDWLAALPDGLDTMVGASGLKISGGERRRLNVARALLRDAPFLVLDEPGEGLDPEREAALLEAVMSQAAARGILLITHSLTALDAMDEIVVLDAGRIVERGTPQALAQARGAYHRLRQQLGEFDPGD
ncbi:MAG: thiol reductant ABC exporter subunit CydC [Hyphomicrobiales bacterium]|nr:MAG: thiol reductant ABC exporter subunit CydC [Hyphomicrobiales bacterium]